MPIRRQRDSSGHPGDDRRGTAAAGRSMSTSTALAATIAALGIADIVRSAWLPGEWHLAANVGLTVAVGAIARSARVSTDEIGWCEFGRGLRWGGASFAAIAGAVAGAAMLAPGWSVFHDDRVDIPLGELLVKVLIVIPIGTVALEELAFRGSLLALLRRTTSTKRAVLVSSVLFGLWHVPGVVKAGSADSIGTLAAVAGTVAATTLAGIGFCWLRLRSGSLLAPALAHVATNSAVFTVAWSLSRS
jgi:uncharacterized protein